MEYKVELRERAQAQCWRAERVLLAPFFADWFSWFPWCSHILFTVAFARLYTWTCSMGALSIRQNYIFWVVPGCSLFSIHLWTHRAGFRYMKMFRVLTPYLVLGLDHCLQDRGKLGAWSFFTSPSGRGIALAVKTWNAIKLWKAFSFSQGKFLLERGIAQVNPRKV